MEKKSGYRCTIALKHFGCWAYELHRFLVKKNRADLELVIYLLMQEQEWYKVMVVIRSKEKKEISKKLEYEIRDFLFDHQIVRAFKPNIPRPSPHKLVFLVCVEDKSVPGAIRIVKRLGCWFEPLIGMPVDNDAENLVFFTEEPGRVGSALEEYAKFPALFQVLSSETGPVYNGLGDIVNDPYFLVSVLMEPDFQDSLKAEIASKKIGSLLEKIGKYASWFIQLLKEILRWASKANPPYRI